jgi:CheY-like chemotaxis protein/two-component sensor histidine kinase
MRTNGETPKVDVGILTIKDEEFEAVLAQFSEGIGHYEAPSHRHYSLRLADAGGGLHYRIAIARQVEQGTGDAHDLARDLMTDLAPRLIIVVGIAGGIPSADFTLGDVVVSTRIHDYTLEARKDGGASEYAITGGPMSRSIVGAIANLRARTADLGDWTEALPPRPSVDLENLASYGSDDWRLRVTRSMAKHFAHAQRSKPVFITGPIGSSDRLIKDPQVVIDWLQTARSLLAVEMESAGTYRAARDRCPMLAVRGISDVVGLVRDEAWVRYACATAAAFAKAFLRTRPVSCGDACQARKVMGHPHQDVGRQPTDLSSFLTTKLLADRPTISLQGLRVLVVDDEEMIIHTMRRLLQSFGAEPQFANDGVEALQLFSAAPPDLILADIVMPRLDGPGLAQEIHSIDPSIPIIFMSGYPQCLAEPMTKQHSCAILEKPIRLKELYACLQNAVTDDFRLNAPFIWPDSHDVIHAYNQCRRQIVSFLEDNSPGELFATVLRHKLKECVHACSTAARFGKPGLPLLAKLENQIAKLQGVAAGIRFGTKRRFTDYVQDVLSDLAKDSPGVRIERYVDENIDLLLDPEVQSLLTMAILELVGNARDALSGHGTIWVSVRQRASADTLLLRVGSDSGPIPPSIASRIFDEGVTTKADACGMGLALIQAMAARLGGQIRLVVEHDGVEFVLEAPPRCMDYLHPGPPPPGFHSPTHSD